MPVVIFFACLDLEEKSSFLYGHYLSILRINPPKFKGGLKPNSDKEIGQKGMLFKDLMRFLRLLDSMPGPVPRHRL